MTTNENKNIVETSTPEEPKSLEQQPMEQQPMEQQPMEMEQGGSVEQKQVEEDSNKLILDWGIIFTFFK